MIQNAIKDTFRQAIIQGQWTAEATHKYLIILQHFPDISITLCILNNCNGSFFLKIFLQNLNVMLSLQTILLLGFSTSI